MEKIVVVIPARFSSTRLAEKPLADIHGKPMIQWVYEGASRAKGIDQVWVATDDERIASVVRRFDGKVMMTSSEIQSGTDRVAAVADQINADIYVNVQGDEPLIDARAIEKSVELVTSGKFSMSTVMTPIRHADELTDSSVVKVIFDKNERAIYFSRLPIPYSRGTIPALPSDYACRRHVGLYVYRKETLSKFRQLPPSLLEKAEVLEQLRALESGISIGITEVDFVSIGVDTPEDLEKVRQFLS